MLQISLLAAGAVDALFISFADALNFVWRHHQQNEAHNAENSPRSQPKSLVNEEPADALRKQGVLHAVKQLEEIYHQGKKGQHRNEDRQPVVIPFQQLDGVIKGFVLFAVALDMLQEKDVAGQGDTVQTGHHRRSGGKKRIEGVGTEGRQPGLAVPYD
ncbi:MAG: hypothetical protein LUD84_09815 [Clostridiales bacterium]|nr:hypothetical protein [Clostridiales bacterium]